MTREEAAKTLAELCRLPLLLTKKETEAVEMAIEVLKEPEAMTLDYHEKCIFLAAMGKERRVCQEMDKEYEVKAKPLVPIVDSVERKVKAVLWGENNG